MSKANLICKSPFLLKFSLSEKATKIWKNIPLVLTLLSKKICFVITSERFFPICGLLIMSKPYWFYNFQTSQLCLLISVKTSGIFFQIFLPFSEKLNFTSTMTWYSLWNSVHIFLTWYMNYFLGPFLHRRRNECSCWDLALCPRWYLPGSEKIVRMPGLSLVQQPSFGIVWVSFPAKNTKHYPTFIILIYLGGDFGG